MIYILKGRLLKNLLVFLRKIEDLTFFLSAHSEKRKKSKNGPLRPRQSSSAKIGHVGVYFAKTGCKIEAGFTDIFGFQVMYLELDWSDRWGRSFISGLLIRFAAKRENDGVFYMGQKSIFLYWPSHIDRLCYLIQYNMSRQSRL